ncbi:MAG: Ig-like domain-containing protein [Deltaproteobacteria bacterium]|nr:Ig-like domain-containing protein [Myxococcales bacterium]MDP3214710.1 Ig-like domain-containing protein [Deltaproteobacteria bacterium]
MSRRLPCNRLAPAPGLLLALLAGCSGDALLVDAGLDAAIVNDLGRADVASNDPPRADAPTPPTPDRRRFPLGATFYLPTGGGWTLAQAPAGNLNAPFRDPGSSRDAFVPHLVGDYRFSAPTGAAVALTVVEPSSIAFHNHDYFPTSAVAVAGSAVFVASVLRPELVAVDPASLAPVFTVPVGGWPVAVAAVAARGALLVACRGEDTLTLVDLATRRPVRSVWIGDEVSNVAVTPDGATAIALLPHDRQVVLIDTADWSELARIGVGSDPHHLAVRADGRSVFVAGRRTGLGADAEANDPAGPDLSEIDLTSRAVTRTLHRLGTTLGGIALSPDGRTLYVTALQNDPTASLTAELAPHFQHTVARCDVTPGAPLRVLSSVDLTRSRLGLPPPGADAGAVDAGPLPDAAIGDAGPAPDGLDDRRAVGLHWIGLGDRALWVVSEANDLLLRLDPDTLVEQQRFDVPGRPRAGAVVPGGAVMVFGHQSQQLTAVGALAGARSARTSMPLGRDPRPGPVARGQRYFTGAGMRAELGGDRVLAGDVWSCSACHADGLTDGVAWQVGPVASYRALTPALTLLEGTWPLGWQGSTSDLASAAFTLHAKIGVLRPTQDQVDGLAAYLASIAPPPAANTLTGRDGEPSPEATRGAAHFAAHCASCHPSPLFTSRERVERGVGDGPAADVASLLGTARHGAWLRSGARRSLASAVDALVDWTRAPLDATQRRELTRYVAELTGGGFFVVTAQPRRGELLPTTAPITLVFSHPLLDRAENLARVQVSDPSGRALNVRLTVEGRRLAVTPTMPLLFGGDYRVVVGAGLESELEVRTAAAQEFSFRTVTQPAQRLSGAYTLTYAAADPAGGPAESATLALTLSSDGGGLVSVVAAYPSAPLSWHGTGTVSGRRLHLPAMPLPLGGGFADATSGFDADLGDIDGDGVADLVLFGTGDGGVRGYTLAGSGFEARDLPWNLSRAPVRQ